MKRIAGLLSVLLLAVLLSGCVDLGIESDFHEDGSVRHTVVGAIDRSALDQLSQMGGETSTLTDQEEARKQAEAKGLEYEPIDNDQQVGAKFSKTYDNADNMGADLNALFSDTQDSADAQPVDGFSGSFKKDGDTWKLDLTINSDELMATTGADTGSDSTLDPSMLDQIFDVTYTATFPGTVKETNGTKIADNKVKWDLPLTGTTNLTATVDAGGGGSNTTLLLIIVIGVLIVVAALVAAWFLLLRRKPMPAGPMSSTYIEPSTAEPTGTPPAWPTTTAPAEPTTGPDEDTRPLPPATPNP